MQIPVARSVETLREHVAIWRSEGLRVAVVPTMGALHEGHLSLVRMALQQADRVIVTLFVNPKQFNDPKDLEKYPRTEEADRALLTREGVHLLYAPAPEVMYP